MTGTLGRPRKKNVVQTENAWRRGRELGAAARGTSAQPAIPVADYRGKNLQTRTESLAPKQFQEVFTEANPANVLKAEFAKSGTHRFTRFSDFSKCRRRKFFKGKRE